MANIYLEITNGFITNHWNYPKGENPVGLVKAPEIYELGWMWDSNTSLATDPRSYAEKRKARYDLLNQDELRFDDLINGTTTWQDAILAIKQEIPK